MANFVKVCKVGDVKAGCGKSVEINGHAVGVFNIDGQIYAINDVCGHRGGPLAEGELDGTTVICPWHGWRYNVTTGENELLPALPTQKFDVKVEDDDILVELP
jgi:nitrite reductase/ring-hydroxylating ferredoxin subunit